eukprot:TRINITY_DN11311_c0_g1_i1.p2 TRINITY_DN11311_c0_g1~~TRINITY_DN11311_c0_g1_i1.p2  ORF type:complete len:107 (+),score=25.88 TRINITY_DN11311_c0_g1_i1:134-454(+)
MVADGHRLPKLQNCPDDIYQIMLACWQQDQSLRPGFEEIFQLLSVFLQNATTDANYNKTGQGHNPSLVSPQSHYDHYSPSMTTFSSVEQQTYLQYAQKTTYNQLTQ